MNRPQRSVAVATACREYEAGRLPLPNFLSALQKAPLDDFEAARKVAARITTRDRMDRILLAIMPVSGIAMILLILGILLSR